METIENVNQREEERKLLFGTEGRLNRLMMKEFSVTEEYVMDGIKILMDWYKTQPHFPKYGLDFDLIECIFAQCKYSIEKAKQKIDCFLSARGVMPEFFEARDPKSDAIELIMKQVEVIVVPQLTPEGYRVAFLRYPDYKIDLYDAQMSFKLYYMAIDLSLIFNKCIGEVYVWDLGNLKFCHISKVTPIMLKKTTFLFQNAYSSRVKAIHVINLPKYCHAMFNLWKTLMNNKIKNRIFMHATIEEMHKKIPFDCLPKDYMGGAPSSEEILENRKRVMSSDRWREWFIRSGEDTTDESKRPVKSDKFDEFLGVNGTFRKLAID